MSDRRKKARMMSDSDKDDDILTLRFLMNGKVRYFTRSLDGIYALYNNSSYKRCRCEDMLYHSDKQIFAMLFSDLALGKEFIILLLKLTTILSVLPIRR